MALLRIVIDMENNIKYLFKDMNIIFENNLNKKNIV
jgi:hypothetical protein